MARLQFDKYQGLGNDFIVVEVQDPETFGVDRARALCERHFGVGGDGVLLVSPAVRPGSRARMTVLNADGSRPEMCGNGLRCVALHLARRADEMQAEFVVDTDAGPRPCAVVCEVAASRDQAQVKTGMGRGELQGAISLEHEGVTYEFTRVSMGNPHAIRFCSPEPVERVDAIGARLSAGIPGGSNVEFVELNHERSMRVVVWERGVGRTLACGTGAAATAVAAAVSGRAPFGVPLEVHLPGGPLEITVAQGSLDVELVGPARWVFSGATDLA